MRVLMFHSVGNDTSSWNRSFLSVNLKHLDYFCRYLKRKNYKVLSMEEWYQMQNNKAGIPNKHVVLTFDDGYLDNWTFVYPVLKKYGLKGTVFINPEFVDPSILKRTKLDDVNFDTTKISEKERLGFLNWNEIKEMDSSGVMDIQSHSMSHNWYFKSDKIIDLYNGQEDYDWLAWIEKPERKPFYMLEDQSGFIPSGYPVFENDRALSLRRYFPDDRLIEEAHNLYLSFRHDKSNIRDTISTVNSLVKEKYPGYFENNEEMKKRYEYELVESKRVLEEKLNKRIDFLCWPGGGYNDLALDISKKVGYKASTIASSDKTHNLDNTKQYKRIPRFGMGSFIFKKNQRIKSPLKNHLVLSLKAREKKLWARLILKTQHLVS